MKRSRGYLCRSVSLLAFFVANVVFGQAVDWPTLGFVPVVTNIFSSPTTITHAGDGSHRVFVEEQRGRIWIIRSNSVSAQPFLDLGTRIITSGAEQGLLGLAFSPGYSTNAHFYVDYTRQPDGAVVISRFSATANPDVADPSSEEVLLVIPKPFNNHNGGQIAFGPDGFLYIGVGDGGSEGDPSNRGQNTAILLGKLLRIDVEGGVFPYSVPTNNPFVGRTNYAPEIWALGLRNPWRFSFDRLTGDLFIGDVGQNYREEIDFQAAGSAGGQNYGWRIMEGPTNYNVPAGFTNFSSLTLPVAWYEHTSLPTDLSGSVTGGYLYRGPHEPRMDGIYLFGDFVAGWIWGLKKTGTNWQQFPLVRPTFGAPHFYISTFGEDEEGRLYLADYYSGKLFQIQDSQQVWSPVFSPPSGIANSNSVIVTSASLGATIHYTTNGADPTELDPAIPADGHLQISRGTTNKARAFRSDLAPSAVATAVYGFQAGAPFFTPRQGPITNQTPVTISTVTPGAAIYYTTNGAAPTTNSLLYSAPLILSGGVVLRAFAVADGYTNSPMATASYSAAQVVTPVFQPSTGPITNNTTITITCATPGAVIYYTLEGSLPTTNSAIYSAPLTIKGQTQLSAFAVASGYVDSPVQTLFYALVSTAIPVFAPPPGPVAYGTAVSLSSATPGATIYYTIDGSPASTNSQVYTSSLVITHDVTVSAMAAASEHRDSPVTNALFTLIQAAMPNFLPAEGPLTNGTMIAIQTATSNAVIRYTENGNDPDTNSPVYSGPLTFSAPMTLKAQAFAPQLDPSNVRATSFGLLDPRKTVVTTVAGNLNAGFSNGIGAAATFSSPLGLCIDPSGNLYVADSGNNVIRKILPSGEVTTFAGTGVMGSQIGPATNAQFAGPTGVCLDGNGNAYVADNGNCNRICKIDTNGMVSVYANVTLCGPGIGNWAPGLWQLEMGPDGKLYVGYWARVEAINPDGSGYSLAGTGCACPGGWGLNVGPGVDAATNVYSATENNLWKSAPDGQTELFAGGISGFSDGPRQVAAFYYLQDVAVDASTNILLCDWTRIRKIDADGWTSTLAGTGVAGYKNGRGSEAQFNNAVGLCVDTNGNVYVADTVNNCIRKISPDTYGIGIPDSWQLANFGHIGIDPQADPDHDGMTNFEEFWAGTNPNDSNSALSVSINLNSGSGTLIRWKSVAGKSYSVTYSTDLTHWTALGGVLNGTGSVLSITDSASTSPGTARFYRVVVEL